MRSRDAAADRPPVAGINGVSALEESLVGYLRIRRALGYKLMQTETLLGQFVDYLDQHGEQRISTERAVAWATLPGASDIWHYQRLMIVRGFASYLHGVDLTVEVPPAGLLPCRQSRATPFLYRDEEVLALIAAASGLRTPHRAATYQTLIGLLASTGMRIGEAIGLDRQHLDSALGTVIVCGKFSKTRELPLTPSTVQALCRYLDRDDRPVSITAEHALFVSSAGTRLKIDGVESTFGILRSRAAINPRATGSRPTIHALRHTFAVRTMLDAYHDDIDPGAQLAILSTYLGHVNPANTYWYLQAAQS
jgi:integrase